jgi:transposase
VSYLGLNPRVKQSGGLPASHGKIIKHGRAHARGMLVEAAFTAARTPRPLRARSMNASARVAACRSRSPRPPGSSGACARR